MLRPTHPRQTHAERMDSPSGRYGHPEKLKYQTDMDAISRSRSGRLCAEAYWIIWETGSLQRRVKLMKIDKTIIEILKISSAYGITHSRHRIALPPIARLLPFLLNQRSHFRSPYLLRSLSFFQPFHMLSKLPQVKNNPILS